MTLKIYCFKWGTKYGPEYVNRLYKSICKNYKGSIVFTCITDDKTGLNSNINIIDYNTSKIHSLNNVFTIEKLKLFDPNYVGPGNNILFDIDVLCLKDFTSYIKEYNFVEPRFIKNYWANPEQCVAYFHKGACDINSSFITWKDNQLEPLYKFYIDNKKKINFLFKSFDKSLFGIFRDKLKYHPRNIVYAYNFGADHRDDMKPDILRDNYYFCLFTFPFTLTLSFTLTLPFTLTARFAREFVALLGFARSILALLAFARPPFLPASDLKCFFSSQIFRSLLS